MKIAVLLSGNGSTLQNILDRIDDGSLNAQVACVVASRGDAYGLERARRANIPAVAVPRKDHANKESFSSAIWTVVDEHEVDLVVLAGFMSLLSVPESYAGRIMNVHPALIPSFSGKGMYGHHVHQAVLDRGVKITGVTVHFVDEKYDHGPIVLQASVPVEENDTADTLAERVQEKEREVYPEAVQLFVEGRLKVEDRRVHILERDH